MKLKMKLKQKVELRPGVRQVCMRSLASWEGW